MPKKIQTGIADFAKIRDQGLVYVDKTNFIQILEDIGSYVSFFRPRRFGKSLFISTLKYYYDYKYTDRFESLFGGTYIGSNPTQLRNSFSVIVFNFSGIKGSADLEGIYSEFSEVVGSTIEKFLISNRITLESPMDYSKSPAIIIDRFLKISFHHLKHPLYILIDEYDHFLNKIMGSQTSDFKTMVATGGFVRNFFEMIKAAADDGLVSEIFMTGVSPITLDSLTSGFNITTNMTLRPPLHDVMGFTADEVECIIKEALSDFDVDCGCLLDKMTKLYNGYCFCPNSKNKLFNSDMVLYYIKSYIHFGSTPKKIFDPNILSDYSKLQSLVSIDLGDKNGANYIQIEDAKKGRSEALISILMGEPMQADITEVYELVKFDQNDFLSYLFYNGYLTIGTEDSLIIPNALIKRVFTDYFVDMSLAPTLGIDSKRNGEAMKQISSTGKNEKFIQVISDILAATPDRLYLHFAETNLQLIGYSIARNYTGYETEIEKDVGYGHIDLTFLPSGIPVNYYALNELKYIKASELNPKDVIPENLEEYRLELIEERWLDALSKLKKYSLAPQFSVLIAQGRLKFWIIIFSTHRCLVNQEIDVNSKELKIELHDFGGWWFENKPVRSKFKPIKPKKACSNDSHDSNATKKPRSS
ncbi:MAG: ATP-binding protein [Clostridiales bacterium]|jgi:hypothetical protein|nr:ATP-binding protein [Clostridiales bacterium]